MMHSEHNSASNSASGSSSSSQADSKILTDLSTLSEQIELCQSMLGTSTYPHTSNEALLAVIGFLEACVPRMVELVDAAAQGALHEETLERCLEVNDALLKTLANFDDPEYKGGGGTAKAAATTTSAAASSPAAAAGGVKGSEEGLAGDLDDLLLDDNTPTPAAVKGGGKSTGEDVAVVSAVGAGAPKDPFAGEPDLLQPTPATTTTTTTTISNAKGDEEDDFDAFLKERTG